MLGPDIAAPVTVFAIYAIALVATAAVCYRHRREILG